MSAGRLGWGPPIRAGLLASFRKPLPCPTVEHSVLWVSDARISFRLCPSGVGFALADEGVQMSYKYRTVRVRGTDVIGTIARKHGSAPEIYETSKDANTSVVPVFFQATGEVRFFDRAMLEDVVTPAS